MDEELCGWSGLKENCKDMCSCLCMLSFEESRASILILERCFLAGYFDIMESHGKGVMPDLARLCKLWCFHGSLGTCSKLQHVYSSFLYCLPQPSVCLEVTCTILFLVMLAQQYRKSILLALVFLDLCNYWLYEFGSSRETRH